MRNGMKTLFAGLASAVCLLHVSDVHGGQPWSLFGNASFVREGQGSNPWAVELVSPSFLDTDDFFGGVSFDPRRDTQFGELEYLGTDYNAEFIGGGSPRFQIALDTDNDGEFDGNIFVYIGTPPNFDDAGPTGWQSTGNLLESTDLRFDTSQIDGTFFDDYEGALELAGDATVLGVSVVVDGGWFDDPNAVGTPAGDGDAVQVVLVDNVQVDNFRLSAKGAAKK